MGGATRAGRISSFMHVLLHPPSVWALKLPSLALVHYLCTYDLYSPVHNVLDACISITWASGRGLGPGIREFFGRCVQGLDEHLVLWSGGCAGLLLSRRYRGLRCRHSQAQQHH